LFEREHHRRIGALLERLDHALLLKHRCLFGGGTATPTTPWPAATSSTSPC
jgi:hypothetical protein